MEQEKLIEVWMRYWTGEVLCLPVFGKVRAESMEAKRKYLELLLAARRGGAFQPFETDARWERAQTREVIAEAIVWDDATLVVPWWAGDKLCGDIYGEPNPALVARAYEKLGPEEVMLSRIYSDSEPTERAKGVFFRQDFDGKVVEKQTLSIIEDFRRLPSNVQVTLPQMTGEAGRWGPKLYEWMLEKGRSPALGPLLCAVEGGKIVGACGPVDVHTDLEGVRFCGPCYFAVEEAHRRRGIGRALRRAMAEEAVAQGATYKLLQAKAGSAAEAFYRAEGQTVVGWLEKIAL